MKLIMWLLVILLVYWALRTQAIRHHKSRQNSRNKFGRNHSAQTTSANQPSSESQAPVENMVACAYCQLYLPVSEAIYVSSTSSSPDDYFCSEEHAKLHAIASKESQE